MSSLASEADEPEPPDSSPSAADSSPAAAAAAADDAAAAAALDAAPATTTTPLAFFSPAATTRFWQPPQPSPFLGSPPGRWAAARLWIAVRAWRESMTTAVCLWSVA